MSNTIPLPPHVGEEYHGPSQSPVKLYDADQLHTHAAAVSAAATRDLLDALRGNVADIDAKAAEIAGLREYIEAAKAVGIRQESIIMDRDARIKVLENALTKIDAIRNDIIGRQKIGWSSHVYPLVAALGEAGYPGMDYEAARAALGDKNG